MDILGKDIAFRVDMTPPAGGPSLTGLADEMSALVNARHAQWTPAQTNVFHLTDTVAIFKKNKYAGRTMTRSYMASAERTFFWTYDEFIAAGVQGPRRPTMYFHDCWHVKQFLEHGQPPNDTEILIDREQDAMAAQLEASLVLQCDEAFLDYLRGYANDRDRIAARLTSGVGIAARVKPHFEIL